MTKPEWGTKRTCQECDATFYDLRKDPITCPKCFTIYDEEALAKKHSLLAAEEDLNDVEQIPEEDSFNDDDFYLETPTELLETLESIEDDYEGKQQHALKA